MGSQLGDKLTRYLERLEASRSPVLAEMEAYAAKVGFPIIGPQCGRVLAILATAIAAKRVFEMGSGFGYSTLWFASAVGPSGEVVHSDFDPNNTALAKKFLSKARLLSRCRFLNGDSLKLLAAERGRFDCILIDIDKPLYPLALRTAVPKLRLGGLLFAHNALWSGKVAENPRGDSSTSAIRWFNAEIMNHPELVSFVDPVHDGLSVSLKVGRAGRKRLPL